MKTTRAPTKKEKKKEWTREKCRNVNNERYRTLLKNFDSASLCSFIFLGRSAQAPRFPPTIWNVYSRETNSRCVSLFLFLSQAREKYSNSNSFFPSLLSPIISFKHLVI
jgi:hypothetical protein